MSCLSGVPANVAEHRDHGRAARDTVANACGFPSPRYAYFINEKGPPMPSIDMPLEQMRHYKPPLYREEDFDSSGKKRSPRR